MKKLWNKSEKNSLHHAVEKYIAGTDHIFDLELMPFDIKASAAHAKGLEKIGILSSEEARKILSALSELAKEIESGKIGITIEDEDCHTVIENYLTEKLGDTGKKIHTGRSRNDQILTAVRLYMKDNLKKLQAQCVEISSIFLSLAEKYKEVPMPGYSHTKQAMLSSVGHYFAAFAESLVDDAEFAGYTAQYIDKSPLGSAAGFGVSIPLDREFTAKELGFENTQTNSLYCQNSRGKFESVYAEALVQIMLTLGKFANDMLLFTSNEFDYFEVEDSLVTGSSIMPHKKNLDVFEILRGNVSVVISNQLLIKDLAKNLTSGYNRDGQLMKKPLIESTEVVLYSLEVTGLVIKGLTPKSESIEAKIDTGIFTVDIANELVLKQGIPFRDAYKKAIEIASGKKTDLKKNLESKVSLGAPGNLGLDKLRDRIKKLK